MPDQSAAILLNAQILDFLYIFAIHINLYI